MTRSTKGAAPGKPQLALPSAPLLDKYGLHAETCECARCALGYRPSQQERSHARLAFQRAQEREIEEQKAREAASVQGREKTRAERREERARETIEIIRRITAPVERPATAEELDELKRMHGFKRRR